MGTFVSYSTERHTSERVSNENENERLGVDPLELLEQAEV